MEQLTDPQGVKYREFCVSSTKQRSFSDNSIYTTKYTFYSFVYIFLFEQFKKLSNLFFLTLAIIQQIPGVSPIGRYFIFIPLSFIMCISAIKEIVEDINRRISDSKINNKTCQVFRKGWLTSNWREIFVGDIIRIYSGGVFPADVILIATSESSQLCYVQTASLDGETNYKIKNVPEQFNNYTNENEWQTTKVSVICDQPNDDLYKFNGRVILNETISFCVDINQVVLRGSHLQNTHWAIGVVVYTGKETKIMQNSSKIGTKRSYVETKTNRFTLVLIAILLFLTFTFSLLHHHNSTKVMPNHWYLNIGDIAGYKFYESFITSFILFNNIIPISLIVTTEIIRMLQSYVIGKDSELYSKFSKVFANVKNSSVIEDFGIVNYLFTDKTGTLTCNKMTLKKISISAKKYDLGNETDCHVLNTEINQIESVKMYVLTLLICNSVLVELNERGKDRYYQSSSPDEIAIIRSFEARGIIFLKRIGMNIHIIINDVEQVWTIIYLFEFNSDRMRMSVIAKSPKDKIFLFVKGADSVIIERLKNINNTVYNSTMEYLEEFSLQGLRTMCIAYKPIHEDEYIRLSHHFNEISKNILDKDLLSSKISEAFENNLVLLGCTGIEDKLQDKVPETIESLKEANINVWMCTGDKLETAVNIGYSCGILKSEMDIRVMSSCSNTEFCSSFLKNIKCEKNIQEHVGKQQRSIPSIRINLALVFSGKDLKFCQDPSCIEDFIDVLIHCESVICCRLSPIEKKNILLMIKTSIRDNITLAIGDGVNDCSMIRAAHVGVGIIGKEGTQAANCSDVAIGEFSHLKKLLFVHGADSFTRLSNCSFFILYKCLLITMMHVYYNLNCMYTSMNIFNKIHLIMYNIVYTALPPFCFGLFDEYCSREAQFNLPNLYKSLRESNYFGIQRFLFWICNSLLHSFLLFFSCYYFCYHGVINSEGVPMNLAMLGSIIFSNTLLVVTFKAALEIRCWSILVHIGIWGGFGSYFIFNTILSRKIPFVNKYHLDSDVLLFKSGIFWTSILIPVIVLLPDLILHSIINRWFISSRVLIREMERSKNIDWNEQNVIKNIKSELSRSCELKAIRVQKYFGFAFSISENVNKNYFRKILNKSSSLEILSFKSKITKHI